MSPKGAFQPTLNPVESRLLLSSFTVTTTADSGAGSIAPGHLHGQ